MRLALALSLALAPLAARASVEEELGLGSRPVALGGAFAAVADEPVAAWYNPAGLALPADHGLRLQTGFQHAQPALWVRQGALAGGQLSHGPEESYDAPAATGFTLAAAADLERLAGLPRVAFGLVTYLPAQRYYFWDTRPSDAVQWTTWDDRTQHLSLAPALAVRLTDRLQLGAGLRVLVNVRTITTVRAESTATEDIRGGESVRLFPQLSPTAGALWRPLGWVRLAFVFRDETYMDDYGSTDITGLAPSGYQHHLEHFHSPRTFIGAVALSPTGLGTLSLEAAYLAWSGFREAHEDVVVPRAGLEVPLPWGRTDALAGYAYLDTPVSGHQARTNYVEPARHVASLGTRTQFLGGPDEPSIDLAWHGQVQMMREQRIVKDPGDFDGDVDWADNAGSPALRAGGAVYNLGLTATFGL